MSAEDNKQATRDGYEAFIRGDAAGAMENMSDSIEWVTAGDSAVSGTYRGKEELGQFWGKLAEKGFQVEAKEFIADGDKVAVIAKNTIGDETGESVDVFTYSDGQMVRFESYGAEGMLDRAFPK